MILLNKAAKVAQVGLVAVHIHEALLQFVDALQVIL